jgi:hypothetical protein
MAEDNSFGRDECTSEQTNLGTDPSGDQTLNNPNESHLLL